MDQIQTVVLGAGVVGLAVARELALQGQEIVLLEAADAFGTGTSSRNSEAVSYTHLTLPTILRV